MTTITSSSNQPGLRAMLRHDLGRIKRMSALFFLLGFLSLPLPLSLEIYNRQRHSILTTVDSVYNGLSMFLFTSVVLLFTLVIALQLMNYNFGKRSVDVYYTLPFTRRQMIGSHLLAGFIGLAAPILLNLLITGGIAMVYQPQLGLGWLPGNILVWCFLAYTLFAATVMVACLMGNTTDTVLYTLLLNIAPFLILLAILCTFGAFVIGFDPSDLLSQVGQYMHPLPFCLVLIMDGLSGLDRLSLWGIGSWVALTAGITFLCLHFYQHRDAATAENVGRDNWFKLILKIGSAYLFSVGFAMIILYAVADSSLTYFGAGEKAVFLVAAIVGAILGYILLEVVFARGFKTLRSNWWICTADIVAALAVALLSTTGLLGYENSVPDPATVQSATVRAYTGYNNYYEGLNIPDRLLLTDSQSLELLTRLHTEAVTSARQMADGESTEDHNYTTLQVEYRLTNGCTVRRSYYGLYLNDAGWEELRQLFTSDEIVRQRNPVLQLGQGDVQLDSLSLSGLDGENTPVDTATARLLLEAAQKDIFHTLTQNHGYIGDVSGFLNVRYSYPAQTYEGKRLTTDNRYADIQIPLYDGFESTGALLQEENLALAPFDPADYTHVYAGFSRYDLYQDPSVGQILGGLAYYSTAGYPEGFYYDSDLGYTQSAETVEDTAVSVTNAPPALPELTLEEVQQLYTLSSSIQEAQDEAASSLLLFDTGRENAAGSRLMLIRFILDDRLAELPEELLEKLGISLTWSDDGRPAVQYHYEMILDRWPTPDDALAPQ